MKKLLSATLLGLVASLSASAADYQFSSKYHTISYSETRDQQVIFLRGNILSGIVDDLSGLKAVRKLIKPGKDIVLNLNSGGGFQVKFNQLSKSIKEACYPNGPESKRCEVTTRVTSICASACIPLFMVGDVREAGRYASFGFHQAAAIPGALKIPGMAQRDLRKNGVNEAWLEANSFMFDSLDMTWLRPENMQGSDIVTDYLAH